MQVPFENVKVTFADRDSLKEAGKCPLGQFPTMEVDGKIVCQTGAIARFCGKLGGFYPKDDDFAAAKIDEIIDTATDITVSNVWKAVKSYKFSLIVGRILSASP